MSMFLTFELPYLFVALFFILVFLFVATRPFVSPLVMKRGFIPFVLIIAVLITTHFVSSKNRAENAIAAFENGKTIICSNRRDRVGQRNIEIKNNQFWRVEGLYFIHADGAGFMAHQCLIK